MREGWEYKRIGDVANVIGGSTPKTNISEYWDGNNYWVTPAELNGSKYIKETIRTITDLAVKKTNLTLMPIGTVLLSSRAPIGKVCITESPMYCNQGFKNLVCGKELYNEFAYYYLKHNAIYLQSIGTGATFKEISKKVVENVIIPIPPISEQERIVSELDLLSCIIEKKKAQLKELDNLAQSIFYDMFGDPVTNENGWEVKKLGEVCEIVRGGSPRPIDNYLGGDIPWIKIGDATTGDAIYLHSTKEHIIESGLNKTRYIPEGSLIFANCGVSLGFARIITFKGCIHDGWLAMMNIKEDKLGKIFLLKSLNFCTQYFRNLAPEGTQPNLNTNIMKVFKQILPPLSLQQFFAEKVEAIEKQKALVQQSISETETLFNSRMDYYFN